MHRFTLAFCILFWSYASNAQEPDQRLANKAATLEDASIRYVPDYVTLSYPMGDVPAETGVCSDVVVRAFRLIDIDLQKEVHEDMAAHFDQYPQRWGLTGPDKNIDHRRVPNLMFYFERQGWQLPISDNPDEYLPGDIVAWNLGGGITHIGIVVDEKTSDGNFKVIHNIGGGQVIEDILFSYKIIGHYRRKL